MKPKTVAGLLVALLVVVVVSFVSVLNRDLLAQPFALTGRWNVPLWSVLLAVFLAGFLPIALRLALHGARRDLEEREKRRETREAESLEHSFRRALDLHADGQVVRATRELEVVLDERPEHFAALLLYGVCQRQLGKPDEALLAHQRAAAAAPRSVAALYQLISDYEARGDRAVAEEIRSRILREFSDRGLAVLRHRRTAAMEAEDWREATRLQEEIDGRLHALGERPRSGPEVRLGIAYRRGVALLEEERPADAAEIFGALLADHPQFLPARIMLGEAHLLAGSTEEAVEEWRRGFETTRSPVFLRRIEDHCIERGEPERAIECFHALAASTDKDLLPRFFLGKLYYRLEMLPEAFKVLEPLEKRLEASPTFHFLLGRLHERRGEMARAARHYQACARQLGAHTAEFACRECGHRFEDWRDRCEGCGSWGSVEMSFEEEHLSDEELGLVRLPSWTASEAG
ncbi:MAG TPA: tetratricopeptide repeat protein [Thermoanaerobaculia bacterium]|nr:tetratricopeptide repeat protein [Thermoanaerobaculia bacterium]